MNLQNIQKKPAYKTKILLSVILFSFILINFVSAQTNSTQNETSEFLIINLTSSPEAGELIYYNSSNNDPGFQYIFTNSSEVESCSLIYDNTIIASQVIENNVSNFAIWNNPIVFNEGTHTWRVVCNMTNSISNSSEERNFELEDYTRIAPMVSLSSLNNQIFNQNETIEFQFNYTNTSAIQNCTLYLDNNPIRIWDGIVNNWTILGNTDSINGRHTWRYECTNINNKSGRSENKTFYRLNNNIIPEDLFLTYNSSNSDFSNTIGLYIGSENDYGNIEFTDNVSLLLDTNLSQLVKIERNMIFINSTLAPWLNESAILTFNKLTLTTPRILKDGNVIDLPYTYSNGILVLNVSGFSEYKIEETPSPSTNSGGSGGGGGGGGGGASSSRPIVNIIPNNSTINVSPVNNVSNVSINPFVELETPVEEMTNESIAGFPGITGAAIGMAKRHKLGVGLSIIILIFALMEYSQIRKNIKDKQMVDIEYYKSQYYQRSNND